MTSSKSTMRYRWRYMAPSAAVISGGAVLLLASGLLGTPRGALTAFTTAVAVMCVLEALRREIFRRIELAEKMIHRRISDDQERLYRQVEALLAIHAMAQFERPAPAFRGWPAAPDFVMTVATAVFERASTKSVLVLECGSGASTIALGSMLKRARAGRLISLESDHAFFERTLSQLSSHDLLGVVDLQYAPLGQHKIGQTACTWYEIPRTVAESSIDVLIIDGPRGDLGPVARYPAVPLLAPHLKPHAVLILDDFKRRDEQEAARRWIAEGYASDLRELDTETGAALLRFCAGIERT